MRQWPRECANETNSENGAPAVNKSRLGRSTTVLYCAGLYCTQVEQVTSSRLLKDGFPGPCQSVRRDLSSQAVGTLLTPSSLHCTALLPALRSTRAFKTVTPTHDPFAT